MIIRKIGIGNANEAFIENSLSDLINVISSDDNNKGKTIVIQSLMYCLGNTPTFPSTFNYQDYHHIVEFVSDDKTYILCRKKDAFVLKASSGIMFFDGVSELKRYWTKHIFSLPIINKNGIDRIVDPELFVQLFFVGQDKKDTSNISNIGFYNKVDFINMLYSLTNLGAIGMPSEDIEAAKIRINDLKDEKKTLLKQHSILKSKKKTASYLSSINDWVSFEINVTQAEKIKEKITSFRKNRTIALIRKGKCEVTLKELNSLNRTINSGELCCLDCNSSHIGFRSANETSHSFDVSTPEIRKDIIASIQEKISSYDEEIERYSNGIAICQEELQGFLDDDDISLETLVAYKRDIYDASGAEQKIIAIDTEIQSLETSMHASKNSTGIQVAQQHKLVSDILDCMNQTYKQIDPSGNLVFESLFTRRDQIFSGSEATEFHLVKMYSLAKILSHKYPIVIDSFRAEDLSTDKENKVIELFYELEQQVIFTTTLKNEESGKYKNMHIINHIDYSDHMPSKMLNKSHLPEFNKLLSDLSIKLIAKYDDEFQTI